MPSIKRVMQRLCFIVVLLGTSSSLQANTDSRVIEEGIASYYSDYFQGRTTASGDTFNQQELTAAHKTLPFGTRVKVVRTDTGQEVEVVINDRGPFIKGRVIDLTKRAAQKLGMLDRGVAPVLITQAD
ncbi:MAG: septal ring lytic transglycosylase RlpA family protein [Halomonas sp.]|nr:septal ring lytic transglycosylase RlpA family protein [Halomonas sp.]TVM06937.1 MAG: septal ring lytic transglycosylase RlpA family protein [Halomonas sp.]